MLLAPMVCSCGLILDLRAAERDQGGDGGIGPADAGSVTDAAPGIDATVVPRDSSVSDAVSPRRDTGSSCGALCGDADGNGSVDSVDVEATRTHVLGGPPPACIANVDVDADGVVDDRDVYLARQLASGSAIEGTGCVPCAHDCGDADGNGMVDRTDVDCLVRSCTFRPPYDACELLTADVNRDGSIDAADGLDLEGAILRGGTVCVP
jgi:hypothetical protein